MSSILSSNLSSISSILSLAISAYFVISTLSIILSSNLNSIIIILSVEETQIDKLMQVMIYIY